jgi:hypothetical protein
MQKIVMWDQLTQLEITKKYNMNFKCFSWRSRKFVMWTSYVSVADHKNLWCELHMFQLQITKICDVNFICFSCRSQKFVTWTSHVLVGEQNNLWHVVLHMFWLYFTKNLCFELQMTWLEFTLQIPWQNIWCSSLQMGCKAWIGISGVLIQNCRIKSWSKMVQNMIPKAGFAVFLLRYYSIYCPSYLGELSPHWCLDACLLVFSLAQNSSRLFLIISEATKHQISAWEYPIPFRACQILDCYFWICPIAERLTYRSSYSKKIQRIVSRDRGIKSHTTEWRWTCKQSSHGWEWNYRHQLYIRLKDDAGLEQFNRSWDGHMGSYGIGGQPWNHERTKPNWVAHMKLFQGASVLLLLLLLLWSS